MSVFFGILKYLKYCFPGLFLISVSIDIHSQATGDPNEDFLYGEYYITQGLYQEALPFYLSALKENPESSNINYRIGQCYMKTIGEQRKALPYLKKAVIEIDEHYVEGRYKNHAAPKEAWLLLGDAYHRENDLMKASFAYHQYKKLVEKTDKNALALVMDKIMGLGVSSEFQRSEHDIRMVNLGKVINSRFSDYNPVLSGDQKVIIYTQLWETYDRIMIAHRTAEGWSTPESLTEKIGSLGNCYTSALSFDGNELYLIWHDASDYDIYVTYCKNGEWTKIVPVFGKVNTRYRESSVGISADGNFIFFASDRPGGKGGFDIYRAERISEEWTNIINIGENINTEKNEEAPYITYDGTTLYFSSNGHESVGNMDILYSELDETGDWMLPVNVGLPVNTTKDDIFYVYYPDTRTGYLARDLAEGFGKNDLYLVQTGDDPRFIFEDSFPQSSDTTVIDSGSAENQNLIPDEIGNHALIINSDSESVLPDDGQFYQSPEILSLELACGYIPDYSLPLDSIPTYTIQLCALRHRIDPKRIQLKPVMVSKGDDGLYRYTYNEFMGYSKALEDLDSIRNSGFPDAFIRNINTVQNYAGYGN